MAKKKYMGGILIFLIGALVIFFNFNTLGNPLGRESLPAFDGEESEFKLVFKGMANNAIVDNKFWATIDVVNEKTTYGEMFVQCSILDQDEHGDWLPAPQSLEELDIVDNCVADEPFTQTAKVKLDGGKKQTITFSMLVPDNVDGNNVLYCATFEKCYSEGVDPMCSSSFTKEIIIEASENYEGDDASEVIGVPEAKQCITSQDCSQLFWAPQECIDGLCLDKKDKPKKELNIDLSDNTIKEWTKENSIMAWLIGISLVMIGFFYTFHESKKPKNPYVYY